MSTDNHLVHYSGDFKLWCDEQWSKVEDGIKTIVMNLLRYGLLHTDHDVMPDYSWIRDYNDANGSYKEVRLNENDLRDLVKSSVNDLQELKLITPHRPHNEYDFDDTSTLMEFVSKLSFDIIDEDLQIQPKSKKRNPVLRVHDPAVTLTQLLNYEHDPEVLIKDLNELIIFSLIRGTRIQKAIMRMSEQGRQRMLMLAAKFRLKDAPRSPKDITINRIQSCFPELVAKYLHANMGRPIGDLGELPACLAHWYGICLVPTVGYEKVVSAWDEWHKRFIRMVQIKWDESHRESVKRQTWLMDRYTDDARRQLLSSWGIKSDDGRTFEGTDQVKICDRKFFARAVHLQKELNKGAAAAAQA